MKIKHGAICAVVGLALVSAASSLGQPENSGGKKVEPPAAHPPGGMDDEMAKAMATTMPGPVHERLSKLAGDWTTSAKMTIPGMGDQTSAGTAKVSMVLGGRFVHEMGEGEMMGVPMTSNKSWGYNNGSKKFEAVWSYTMSTGFLYMKGESKDDGKTIEWDAWFDNEVGVKEEFKGLTTFVSEDEFTFKLYGGKMPDGTPGPTLVETYTRKK